MKWLTCLLLGHRYYVVQEFSLRQRRIFCERCRIDLAMNDSVKVVVDWDSEFAQMYRDFGHVIVKPWR
jgi:hypothetical protein